MASKSRFADKLRVLADQCKGEPGDEQLRAVRQAGELLEHAIALGYYLPSDSFPKRSTTPQCGPIRPLILDPHVRWVHAIANWLVVEEPGFVRREPGGMCQLDTTGSVDAAIRTWRYRGLTMSHVLHWLADEIGAERQEAAPSDDDGAPAADETDVTKLTVDAERLEIRWRDRRCDLGGHPDEVKLIERLARRRKARAHSVNM